MQRTWRKRAGDVAVEVAARLNERMTQRWNEHLDSVRCEAWHEGYEACEDWHHGVADVGECPYEGKS